MKKQKKIRNIKYKDIINLDRTIARFILPRLKFFKKKTYTYPIGFTIEEWKSTCKELNVTDYDIYSYNKICMAKYMDEILKTKYDVIIVDEAHHISNRKNKSTKKLLLKIDTIRLKYLLTATPENYEWQDFYIYFRIIFGKSFMSYTSFASRYFIQRQSYWNPYVYEVIGYVDEYELMDMKDSISIV